jgi:hypothetical protein
MSESLPDTANGINLGMLVSFPIGEGFKHGNHRSESRWERQACEALTLSSEIDNIYLTNPVWTSTATPKPKNLHNSFNEDCVVIMQGFQPELLSLKPKHGFIINAYAHYLSNEDQRLLALKKEYGGKLVITSGWKNLENQDSVKEIYGVGNYADLYLPHIATPVYNTNNFKNKILLWSTRNLHGHLAVIDEQANYRMVMVMRWVARHLAGDSSLEFHICSGDSAQDALALGYNSIEDLFWANGCTAPLLPVESQVCFHPALDWNDMLAMYQATKLVVSPILPGGQPIECGMYGIPHFGSLRTKRGPMAALAGYLFESDVSTALYLSKMEEFMTSEREYLTVGENYRAFVNETYSYDIFVQQVIAIVKNKRMY